MTRVVLFGGAGFIGAGIAGRLAQAHQVVVADQSHRLARSKAHFDPALIERVSLDGDPYDFDFLDRADTLIHLDWASIPATSMSNYIADLEANVVSSLRLFEAAAARAVAKIVFVSSGGTVYGRSDRDRNREDDPTNPRSSYGIGKLTVEKYLALFAQTRRIAGVSLRLANPYGSYQFLGTPVGAVANFLARAHAGEPITVWGDGSAVRDFVHIDDVAAAFELALTAPALGDSVYNVGSGVGHSVNQLLALVESIAGRTPVVRYEPARFVDVPRAVLDHTRFSAATGWRPRISLRDGMELMWQYLDRTY